MKLFTILTFFLVFSLNAQNLKEILGALKESKKVKVILEKTKSEIAQNEMSASYEAPEFGLNVAQAEDSVEDGIEYSISFSQNISQPFSTSTKNKGVDFLSLALKEDAKYQLHILEIEVASRYHKTCVSKEMQNKARLLFIKQSDRYKQLQKAYDLGEISKKNLLFNKLDLAKLKQSLKRYKRVYLIESLNLQETIDNLTIADLSCDDLIPLSGDIKLVDVSKHSQLKKIAYQERSSKSFYETYDATLQSIGYQIGYDQELDTKRVSFGVSIPLGSLTSQKEKLKAHYLYMNSAYTTQKESAKKLITSTSNLFKLKVKALYDEYEMLRLNILPLNAELVELSKLAYSEGEGTIMEYLDATRSYSENILEMLEVKKSYYEELFELYKKADLELGENYEEIN